MLTHDNLMMQTECQKASCMASLMVLGKETRDREQSTIPWVLNDGPDFIL
jgi:hypothetical protein